MPFYFEKKSIRKIFPALFLAVLFVCFSGAEADKKESTLVINEVRFDSEENSDHDYVEIYNSTAVAIDLNEYELLKMTASGKIYGLKSPLAGKSTLLDGGKYYLWASNSDKKFPDEIEADASTGQALADKNAVAIVKTSDKTIVDSVGWGNINCSKVSYCEKEAFNETILKSFSIGRLNKKDTDDNSKDFIVQNPTPREENKKLEEKTPDPPKEYSKNISITELFPNPFQSQYEEYIELYNGSDEKIDLKDWTLHDASKNGEYTFPKSLIIEAKKFLAIFKKDFKFALNNSGNESVTLLDPNNAEVARAEYGGSKKNVSYNFDGANWRWSKFLTPEKENILNNEPRGTLKVDKDVFVNVYADFSISTKDADGEKVKVTWNFGDGRKSYLSKTRHKFVKTGKYEGSVKLGDGSEDVVKNFTVNVKEFPHPKVAIVAINANPAGADTGVESLTIQNKEKKKINLNGWSIATGWKEKFVNHPIKEDVVIKGKKEKEIRNDVSSFTLNNAKAKIQLRYPDGEVAHEVKYKSSNKTIADGEIYQKEKGKGWEWIIGQDTKNKIQPARIATQSVAGGDTNNDQNSITDNQTAQPEIQDAGNVEEPAVEVQSEQKLEDVQIELPKVEVENKIISASNNGVKIELLKSQPRVLGASTVREVDGHYFFTPDVQPQEHYAVSFFKNIFFSINGGLNNLLNYFSK